VVGSYWEGGLVAQFKGKIISFGIFFQPVGLSLLFHIPPAQFANRCLNALDFLPAEVGRLYQQLAAACSFPSRVAIAEQFLRKKAAQAQRGSDDIGCDAAARIFRANGTVKMRDFAASYGLSLRHFERRVKDSMGVSAKTFSRVARFQTALDTKLLTPQRPWLAIAHDLGYHDQMHMIHDFHELVGAAPTEVLETIRDARPPAMQTFRSFEIAFVEVTIQRSVPKRLRGETVTRIPSL
jgi:AraC-like DNA-binding protein